MIRIVCATERESFKKAVADAFQGVGVLADAGELVCVDLETDAVFEGPGLRIGLVLDQSWSGYSDCSAVYVLPLAPCEVIHLIQRAIDPPVQRLVQHLGAGVALASRLLEAQLPRRLHTGVYEVVSRVYTGERSGGDYSHCVQAHDGGIFFTLCTVATYRDLSVLGQELGMLIEAHVDPADLRVAACLTSAEYSWYCHIDALGNVHAVGNGQCYTLEHGQWQKRTAGQWHSLGDMLVVSPGGEGFVHAVDGSLRRSIVAMIEALRETYRDLSGGGIPRDVTFFGVVQCEKSL